jgi:hypothetical protein
MAIRRRLGYLWSSTRDPVGEWESRLAEEKNKFERLANQVGLPWVDKHFYRERLLNTAGVSELALIEKLNDSLQQQVDLSAEIEEAILKREQLKTRLVLESCALDAISGVNSGIPADPRGNGPENPPSPPQGRRRSTVKINEDKPPQPQRTTSTRRIPCSIACHKQTALLLRRLDEATEEVVRLIAKWRENLSLPLPFFVREKNYLCEIARDCAMNGVISTASSHLKGTSRHLPFFYASTFDAVAAATLNIIRPELKYAMDELLRQKGFCERQIYNFSMGIYVLLIRPQALSGQSGKANTSAYSAFLSDDQFDDAITSNAFSKASPFPRLSRAESVGSSLNRSRRLSAKNASILHPPVPKSELNSRAFLADPLGVEKKLNDTSSSQEAAAGGGLPSWVQIDRPDWKDTLLRSYSSALKMISNQLRASGGLSAAAAQNATTFLLFSTRTLQIRCLRKWLEWLSERQRRRSVVANFLEATNHMLLGQRFTAWQRRITHLRQQRQKTTFLLNKNQNVLRQSYISRWFVASRLASVSRSVRRGVYLRYFQSLQYKVLVKRLHQANAGVRSKLPLASLNLMSQLKPQLWRLKAVRDTHTSLRPFLYIAQQETHKRNQLAINQNTFYAKIVSDLFYSSFNTLVQDQWRSHLSVFGEEYSAFSLSRHSLDLEETERRQEVELLQRQDSAELLRLLFQDRERVLLAGETDEREAIFRSSEDFYEVETWEWQNMSVLYIQRELLIRREDRCRRAIQKRFGDEAPRVKDNTEEHSPDEQQEQM